MGKKTKEHKKKVEKRNLKIKQQKSGMQKAFDLLVQEQLNRMKEEDVKVETSGGQVSFDIVEERNVEHAFKYTPNEEELAKINKEFDQTPTISE